VNTWIVVIVLVAVLIVLIWYVRRKGKGMNLVPIAVGDREAQVRFLKYYQPFLAEYPNLSELMKKTFLRALRQPSEEERKAVADLPDDDPRAIAFEDKIMADYVIFYHGRIAADDFGEILSLAGNGRGFGALKILRGMYERIVTASFLSKNPAEARRFMDDEAIQTWKLWNGALKLSPDMKDRFPEEKIKGMEQANAAARAKKKESICKTCKQPITDEAWTRLDLASMAEKADYNLAVLYGWCYVEPTFHSHATSFGISHRLRRTDDDSAWTFRESGEEEAHRALHSRTT
jgi:hypothetical protein